MPGRASAPDDDVVKYYHRSDVWACGLGGDGRGGSHCGGSWWRRARRVRRGFCARPGMPNHCNTPSQARRGNAASRLPLPALVLSRAAMDVLLSSASDLIGCMQRRIDVPRFIRDRIRVCHTLCRRLCSCEFASPLDRVCVLLLLQQLHPFGSRLMGSVCVICVICARPGPWECGRADADAHGYCMIPDVVLFVSLTLCHMRCTSQGVGKCNSDTPTADPCPI